MDLKITIRHETIKPTMNRVDKYELGHFHLHIKQLSLFKFDVLKVFQLCFACMVVLGS